MTHERYNGRWANASLPWLVALAAISGGFGCGSSASFNQGVYDDGMVRYQVGQLGPGWRRVEVEDNDLAFHNDALGTVSINSTCTDYEDVPEEALLNHLLFGMRERNYRTEETVSLDGRGALHAVIDLELDGVPLTLELYVLKKDGCVYDMSLIASRSEFERARGDLARLISSFHVLHTAID
jgi:hypothetical protein